MNGYEVKVTCPGGYNGPVRVEHEGATIEQVLKITGTSTQGAKQLLLDGRPARLDQVVHAGQTIYVMPQVAGNR